MNTTKEIKSNIKRRIFQTLNNGMKENGKINYKLIHNLNIKSKNQDTISIDFAIITRNGVVILDVSEYKGQLKVHRNQFREIINGKEEKVRSPIEDTRQQFTIIDTLLHIPRLQTLKSIPLYNKVVVKGNKKSNLNKIDDNIKDIVRDYSSLEGMIKNYIMFPIEDQLTTKEMNLVYEYLCKHNNT